MSNTRSSESTDTTNDGPDHMARLSKPTFASYYRDQVVFISGAASGIGKELSRSLYECGTRLLLADIDAEGLRSLANELEPTPNRLLTHPLDVRQRSAFDECFQRGRQKWGQLDIVFNNAGVGIFGDALEFSDDDWDLLVDVNVKGVINGTIAAIKSMREQGHGKIVNMASVSGLTPFPGMSGYSATKHAAVGFTRCMEIECEDLGISFCTVCPGIVRTPLVGGGKEGAIRGDDQAAHLQRAEQAGMMDVDAFVELTLKSVAAGKSLVIAPWRYRIWAQLVRGFGDRMGRLLVRRMYRSAYHGGLARGSSDHE